GQRPPVSGARWSRSGEISARLVRHPQGIARPVEQGRCTARREAGVRASARRQRKTPYDPTHSEIALSCADDPEVDRKTGENNGGRSYGRAPAPNARAPLDGSPREPWQGGRGEDDQGRAGDQEPERANERYASDQEKGTPHLLTLNRPPSQRLVVTYLPTA